jgi:hypothetical protein
MILKILIIIQLLSSAKANETLNCECKLNNDTFAIRCFDYTLTTTNSLNLSTIQILSNKLDLSFNQLNDNQLVDLNKIDIKFSKLNLSNNQLLIINENQFYNLNKLQILDLSYNQIFYFEMNSFYGLNNLFELNLF